MQGTCNYIPETNHVTRVYSVAFVLYLHFAVHVMIFTVCGTCNDISPVKYVLYFYFADPGDRAV